MSFTEVPALGRVFFSHVRAFNVQLYAQDESSWLRVYIDSVYIYEAEL